MAATDRPTELELDLDLADFDFSLPEERIAQEPAVPREAARLLRVEREGDGFEHAHVRDLGRFLRSGDLLVVNATRVRAARLRGAKATGGAAEALLLETGAAGAGRHRALVRCRGKLRQGLKFRFSSIEIVADAEIVELNEDGSVWLAFEPGVDPEDLGETPLPPYIRRSAPDPRDAERYQTIFAREPGAVAAPTAGLHFTPALLADLAERGITTAEVVLHVGPGTFRPLGDRELESGRLHAEQYELPAATVAAVERTREHGGRVIAVGTTSTRVLESCADESGRLRPGSGETDLFLKPGSRFRVIDGILTNFHLPRSSLLLLVAAFAGRERVLARYREAVADGYRFYSYGDAMLIL